MNEMDCQLQCVIKESIEEEVQEFARDFWKNEERMYLDDAMAFYKYTGNGKVQKSSIAGTLLNPFEFYKVFKNFKKVQKENPRGVPKNNTKGEGLILGGLLVVKKGGEVEYVHREKSWGDCAPIEEVLKACENVSKSRN